MNLLHYLDVFHVEVAKYLDVVESMGEVGGYMEWVNGRVGDVEVYFLWFPKTRRLVYVLRGRGIRQEQVVELKGSLEAIAYAERIIRSLSR